MKNVVLEPETLAIVLASERLEKVEQELRRGAKDPGADTIHDVRVAIRRIRQCLDVFSPVFPTRVSDNIDRRLKKVLGAAGDLRNFDIAVQLIKEAHIPGSLALIQKLRKDREREGGKFKAALGKFEDGSVIAKWRAKLLIKADEHRDDAPDTKDHAHKLLPEIASEFFDAGAKAMEGEADPAALHKLRIRAKKFRYTMELYAVFYGPGLETRMEAVRNVQTRLGDLNDCVASARLLKEYHKRHAIAVARASKKLHALTRTKIGAFRRYWHKEFGPRQKSAWTHYLGGAHSEEAA